MVLMTLFNYIALVLLIIALLWRIPKNFKYITITVGLFAFFLYVFQQTKYTDLLLEVLFIVSSLGIEKDTTLTWAYRTLIIGTVLIILLNLFGFIDQYEMIKNNTIVKSYGFIHPNGLATTVLRILLLYFSLYNNKIGAAKLIIIGVAYLVLGRLTGCRSVTYVLIICMALIIYGLLNKNAFESRLSLLLMSVSPFIAAIFSFAGGHLFMQGSPLMEAINQLFSDRFNWIARYMMNYRITLFGQQLILINRIQGEAMWSSIDNSYVLMGLNYGVLFLLGYCLVMMVLIYYYIKNDDKVKAIICFSLVLIGLTESQTFSITVNFMLLFVGDVIYEPIRTKKRMKF